MSASEQESAVAAEGRVPRGLTRRDLFMGAGGVAVLMGLAALSSRTRNPSFVRPAARMKVVSYRPAFDASDASRRVRATSFVLLISKTES